MAEFSADRSLGDLIARLAERSPAPGAGSAVAWTAAIAAGLLEMVAGFAGAGEVAARASALRGALLEAGERELHAYEPVLEARTPEERRVALSGASEPPLAITRASSEVAELGAQVVAQSKPALKGDAIAGVLLAEAAARAAGRLVEINLRSMPDDPRLAEVIRLTGGAAKVREAALQSA